MKLFIILLFIAFSTYNSFSNNREIDSITVLGDSEYEPFEFAARNNIPRGIIVDIWKLWSKKTGIKVNYSLMRWNDVLIRVNLNQNEIIGGLFYSTPRAETLEFSLPLFEVSTHFFYHSDFKRLNSLSDMDNIEVGVIKGYKSEEYIRSNYPKIKLKVYLTNNELFEALKKGSIKVFIHNYPTAFFYLTKNQLLHHFNHSRQPIYINVMHGAVKKGNYKLLRIINEGLSEITSEEIRNIHNRWVGISAVKSNKWKWLVGILGILLFFIGLIILWNNQLKKRIRIATEALKASEEKYRNIFNAGTEAIITLDPDNYNFIAANDKTFQMFKYSAEELKNQNILHLFADINDQNRDAARLILNQVKNGDEVLFEWNAKCKDGIFFPIEVKLKMTHISGNRVLYASMRNISDRNKIQTEFAKSENRFRQLVELLPLPLAILNELTEVEYINPAFNKQFGYDISDFTSVASWFQSAFPDKPYRDFIVKHWQNLIDDSFVRDYELEYLKITCKNGSISLVNFETVGLENNKVLIVFMDITDQKRIMEDKEQLIKYLGQSNYELEIANKEKKKALLEIQSAKNELEEAYKKLEQALNKAEESNRLKSEFLAVMSHEIRTPLSAMLGFSQLLCLSNELEPQYKKYAGIIFSSSNRLSKLLSDLLELSVIEAGGIKVDYSDFSINTMIEDIYILFESSIKSKEISFTKETNGIDRIYSDEIKIRQILFNLIGNAIKFTDKGSISVNVKADTETASIVISVKDTGIGIDEDNIKKVFELFVQEQQGLSRKFGGTGLGLTICKRLIESMHGDIRVESEKGVGSEFIFRIPIITHEFKKSKIALPPDTKKPGKNKLRILFVDDDPDNLLLIDKILDDFKEQGSIGMSNGKDALNEFKNNPHYDLIILDIQTPEMDGTQCLNEMRKLNATVPIIALTAHAMRNDREKYLSMGFSDYFPKPIDFDSFRNLIAGYAAR